MKIQSNPKALSIFKGYIVDVRCKMFVKAVYGESFEVISFDTEEGDELLAEYLSSSEVSKEELIRILSSLL